MEEVKILSWVLQLEILITVQEGLFSMDSEQTVKENLTFMCQ